MALAALALVSAASSGCVVRVYQPMSGFHRPVVTDPTLPNFADTRLDVHCVPGGDLSEHEAGALCGRVQALFENQGAVVRTWLSVGRGADDELEVAPAEEAPADTGDRIGLSLEIRGRQVHASNHPLSWLLCIASFTLVPGVSEVTFAQDLVIRDDTGFLLATDSLEGRIVTRFGFGSWAGNAIHDLWRPEEEKIVGPTAMPRDLSADLYRQLTQIVFNAKMHAAVLKQAPSARAGTP